MGKKKLLYNGIKIILPLLLGGSILYWMYRDFDFTSIESVLIDEMNWTWMLLSLPFGVLAQAFRGWRWKQTLEPMGEQPRNSVSVNSIFLSYAVSLVIPRVGEFARCGILNRYDRIGFSKALGTVVTERAVDSLIVLLITALAFITQIRVFGTFFSRTGTRIDDFLYMFSTTGWLVTGICGIAALILLYVIRKKLAIHDKVKETLSGIWQGIISLKAEERAPVSVLQLCHLGELLSPFLPDVLLFRSNEQFRRHVRSALLCGRLNSGHRPHTQRGGALAFCRENDADIIWCCRRSCTLFRADCPYHPNFIGGTAWHLRLDRTGFHKADSQQRVAFRSAIMRKIYRNKY